MRSHVGSNCPRAIAATLTVFACALGCFPAWAQPSDCGATTCSTAAGPKTERMSSITRNNGDTECLTTSSSGFVDMPGTVVHFEQGGTIPASLQVSFIGTWPQPGKNLTTPLPSGSQPAGAAIILEIDGDRADIVSNGGGVLVHEGTASSISNGTHGFTFVTEPIAPGLHTAQILWAQDLANATGTICVGARSLVVRHD